MATADSLENSAKSFLDRFQPASDIFRQLQYEISQANLSPHPDPSQAERAIQGLYQSHGLTKPTIHWVSSPMAGAKLVRTLNPKPSLKKSFLDPLRQWPDLERHHRPVEERLLSSYQVLVGLGHIGHVMESITRAVRIAAEIEEEEMIRRLPWHQRLFRRPRGARLPESPFRRVDLVGSSIVEDWQRDVAEARTIQREGWLTRQFDQAIACQDLINRLAWIKLAYLVYKESLSNELIALENVLHTTEWFWAFKELAVISQPAIPTPPFGPIIKRWEDFVVYQSNRIILSQRQFEAPHTLFVDEIVKEPNLERRQMLLHTIGTAELLRQVGGKIISRDRFGHLWQLRLRGENERAIFLEVENSTAENDGTHKRYLLRVPPQTRTPQEGVAWSFGVEAAEYSPISES